MIHVLFKHLISKLYSGNVKVDAKERLLQLKSQTLAEYDFYLLICMR